MMHHLQTLQSIASRQRYQTATIRDFSGGLNVMDSEFNMNSLYVVRADNVQIQDDKTIEVRPGCRLFADGEDGAITDQGTVSLTVDTTNTSNIVQITDTAHGLSTGDHVEISSFASAIGGIPATDFDKRHCITVTGANTYTIRTATTATSTVSAARGFDLQYNTHTISGVIVNKVHYQQNEIVVDTTGEVFKVNSTGTVTRIWDDTFARSLSGAPAAWSPTSFVSFAVFKGDLIVCNGVDKPLLINLDNAPEVNYLQDLGTSSNANTPICRYVIAMPNYVVMAGDPTNPDVIHVSHTGASGTWQTDPAPNVGTQVEMGSFTPSNDATIKGLGRFRDLLLVAFNDSIVPVSLGNIDTTPAHIIVPNDAIEQHGAISHRTMLSIGDDFLSCDDAGVPSIARALYTGAIRPERQSELVERLLQNNIERLSVGGTEDDVFAIFNRLNRQYMLFMPNHENGITRDLVFQPIEPTTVGGGEVIVEFAGPHNLRVGETFTLSGLSAVSGITALQLNTTHTVTAIVDDYKIKIETAGTATSAGVAGGGSAGACTYIYSETFVYVYKYTPRRKLKAWSVYRGWTWKCASVTELGRVIFGDNRQLYVMGNRNDPIHADFEGTFDGSWATSTAYTVGQRIKSPTTNVIYKCLVAHTSDSTGTMEDNIVRAPQLWEQYFGDPIDWAFETPWFDNDRRMSLKHNKLIAMDTVGQGTFTLRVYGDNIRYDVDGNDAPYMELSFSASGAGGYGDPDPPYGGVRLTGDKRPWPADYPYKIAKYEVFGSTTRQMRIASISTAYTRGGP